MYSSFIHSLWVYSGEGGEKPRYFQRVKVKTFTRMAVAWQKCSLFVSRLYLRRWIHPKAIVPEGPSNSTRFPHPNSLRRMLNIIQIIGEVGREAYVMPAAVTVASKMAWRSTEAVAWVVFWAFVAGLAWCPYPYGST